MVKPKMREVCNIGERVGFASQKIVEEKLKEKVERQSKCGLEKETRITTL